MSYTITPGVIVYPATCGADFVACNQLAYFENRKCDVHCLMTMGFGRSEGGVADLVGHFPCIRGVTTIGVSIGLYNLRKVLFAFHRVAQAPEFRALAQQPFDLFFTNYVLTAPLACVLPRSIYRVVETIDCIAGAVRTVELLSKPAPPPLRIQELEERFVFRQIELDLYRAFDKAVMISQEETEGVTAGGYASAIYVPQPFPTQALPLHQPTRFDYDLLFVGSENHLNTFGIRWFYRHIYIPHLRRRGVRLAVAGRVCDNFHIEDALVTQVGFQADLEPLYRVSKLVVVPIFEGTGTAIKLHEALAAGRAVVSTPVGCRGIDPASGPWLAWT